MSGAAVARRTALVDSLPTPVLVTGCVIACAAAATVLAQVGLKGLVVVMGGLGFGICLVFVRDRALFTLVVMIASFQFLFHKSIGPIDTEVSGGAPSIYITSIDVLLLVLYAIWAANGSLMRELRASLGQPIFVVPALGILAVLPSFLAAPQPLLAFAELIRMVWMYTLFVYIALRVRDRNQVRAVVLTLFVIAAIQLVVVVLQWRTGSSLGLSFLGEESNLGVRTLDSGEIARPTGTVVHSDFLAALVAPIGLIAYSIGLSLRDRGWLRWLCLAMVPVAAAPLVIAQTRAALVGFAAAFIVLTAWHVVRGSLRLRVVFAAIALAGTLSLPFWGAIKERVIDNFATEQFQKEVQSRIELNDLSVKMIVDHPVIGVGLNNFEQVMDSYDIYGLIFAGNPVHNIYLLVLSETGLIGLIGFGATAAVVVALPVRLTLARDPLLAGLGVGIVGALVFFAAEEILTFSLRQDMPLALLWVLAGLAVAGNRIRNADSGVTA
jgi:O-antigen ligase